MSIGIPKPSPRRLVKAKQRRSKLRAAAILRAEVRGRDGHQCQCCHIPVFVDAANPAQRAQVHHIKFRSQGGPDKHQNLITVCAGCHAKIHARVIEVRGEKATNVRFIDRSRLLAVVRRVRANA